MNFIERAIKYLWRKRKKTIILLFILIIIYSMVLISINILRTTSDVILSMKAETNAQIIISTTKQENEVTPEMIKSILELDNIKIAKRYGTSYAYPESFVANDKGAKLNNELDNMVRIIGLDDITLDMKFADNVTYIISGSKDIKEKVIINYLLAESNGVNVEETLKFKSKSGKNITTKVAGLYRTKESESNQSEMIASVYRIENCIYMDYNVAKELLEDELKCETAWFTLDNPDLIDDTITKVKAIIGEEYSIKVSDNLYKSLESSMNKTINIISVMLIFSIITAICVITILLSMWIKSRIKEICILNVLGESKFKIVLQVILEGMILFIIASAISIFSSKAIIGSVYDSLFAKNMFINSISKNFQTIDIAFMEILGFAILIICILISILPVLKMKPKDILSMSD